MNCSKHIRKNIGFLTYLLFVVLTVACNKEENEHYVTFHAEALHVEGTIATFVVTHSGTNRDTYCYTYIEGQINNQDEVRQAIDSYIAAIDTSGYRPGDGHYAYLRYLKQQKKKVIKVAGLKPHKEYTFIAFGMNNDGSTYGTAGITTFTTGESTTSSEQYDAWTVIYEGDKLHNDNYYSCVHVWVTDTTSETFFVAEYETAIVNTFNTDADFINYAVEDYNQRWETYDKDAFWKEEFGLHSSSCYHYAHLNVGTQYVAYAIGVHSDGTLTGHFAKSNPFTVDKYTRLNTFDWLVWGKKWFISNDDGVSNLRIEISEESRNESVKMYLKDFSILYKFIAKFNPHDGSLSIRAQKAYQNTYVKINDKSKRGEIHMLGWQINESGDTLHIKSGEIAVGHLREDGSYLFSSPIGDSLAGIGYVLVQADGTTIILPGSAIRLPFVMSKQN